MEKRNDEEAEMSYSKKVWIKGSIFALIVVILLLLKATFSVFLLILAGALIGIFFNGLAGLICRKTKWKSSLCLAVSVIGTFVLIGLLFWLIGSKVQTQIAQLTDTLPKSIENAKSQLNSTPMGQKVLEKITSPEAAKKAKTVASTFFQTTFGVLGDLYVVLFLGIFFTVGPETYKKGIVQLVPARGRKKADDVLNKLNGSLKKWLKGKLFAMLVVFILTSIGLVIIGVPMWLALALMAGILNFIPNFGPLIAMIPAVLVALMQGPATAGFVAGLYILVQVTESNFITPMVQKRLIHIPPAMIIIAQLIVGSLAGGWGIILATPLMVIVMVLVQELYLSKMPELKSA
jgi:predicted PurR-regulated permease PerM